MQPSEHRAALKGSFRVSLSPPVWKDQLKQRCMARLKQDRHLLLAKLRSPDGATTITDEMRRIVRHEGQKGESGGATAKGRSRVGLRSRRRAVFGSQSETVELDSDLVGGTDNSSIDELLADGKLSEEEYLDLVQSLEEALLVEMEMEITQPDEEEHAQHMMDFEEASLEAMLAGMDLDDAEMAPYQDEADSELSFASGEW